MKRAAFEKVWMALHDPDVRFQAVRQPPSDVVARRTSTLDYLVVKQPPPAQEPVPMSDGRRNCASTWRFTSVPLVVIEKPTAAPARCALAHA